MEFEDKFNSIVIQGMIYFMDSLETVLQSNNLLERYNLKELKELGFDELFEFIMNDDYLVRQWAIFWMKSSIDLIWDSPGSTKLLDNLGLN